MPIKKAFYYSYIFLLLNYTNIYSMEEMSDSSLNADGMSDYSNTSISYEIGDRLEYYVNHKNYAKKSSKKNSKNTPSVKEEDEIPLCLSHRNLTKLPTNINYNVESLDLEYNLLSYIDMEIFTAARLIELNISHNNIEIIPQIQSQSLYYLNISYNGIITLEEFWKSDVKKLQHINVSHNKLKEIHCPSNWDQLRRFNIEGNPATSSINLPNNLSHLIAGASNLQIDSWGGLGPSKQFAELSVYVVTYTKISKPSLIIAPNLQILNLSHNDIKYTHYLHNIQSNNIKILILNNNYIEILHIPDFMPKSLRGIFFQNNCLTDIRQLRDIVW
jgi:Leucine-rich repeat (LRR) protein